MLSLIDRARLFQGVLHEARSRAAPENFAWYPFNSLSNVDHLGALMGASYGHVMPSAREERILDTGCGARRLPDGSPMPAGHAVAYLPGEGELNPACHKLLDFFGAGSAASAGV